MSGHPGAPQVQLAEAGQPVEVGQPGVPDPGTQEVKAAKVFAPLQLGQPGVGDVGAAQPERLEAGETFQEP